MNARKHALLTILLGFFAACDGGDRLKLQKLDHLYEIDTMAGQLEADPQLSSIFINDRRIKLENEMYYILNKWTINNSDVILIGYGSGTSCAAMYQLIKITGDKNKNSLFISEPFGSCSDLIEVKANSSELKISIHKSKFEYKNDVLKEATDQSMVAFKRIGLDSSKEASLRKEKKIAAKAAGFKSVNDMEEAAEQGIGSGQEWAQATAWNQNLIKKYLSATNLLERALVIKASRPDSFQTHKDEGGLNVLSSWRGYQMRAVEVQYMGGVLTFIHAQVDTDFKGNKKATINNLKKDLLDECGSEWELKYGGDAYQSNTKFSRCEIASSRNGGYHIIISVKSN